MAHLHTPMSDSSTNGPRDPSRDQFASTEDQLGKYLEDSEGQELFAKLSPYVLDRVRRHSITRVLKPHALDAEDLASGLWIAVLHRESLSRFKTQGRGSLRAYLATCVDHYLKEVLRRVRADKRGGGETPAPICDPARSSVLGIGEPVGPDPGVSTIAAFSDWKSTCIAKLNGPARKVWKLRVEDQISFDDIASQLGITANAARGYFYRANKQLQDAGLLGDRLD